MHTANFFRLLGRLAAYTALFFGILGAGLVMFARYKTIHTEERLSGGSQPVKMLFVGDMMFDRTIRQVGEKNGFDYLFSCVVDRFSSYDLVIGNLEGPITPNPSTSVDSEIGSPDNFTFTFPPDVAVALKQNGVGIVNLGNNHILNQGEDGLYQTRAYLDAAGVAHFGSSAGDNAIYRTTVKGKRFSFVNFNEFGGDNASITARIVKSEKTAGNSVIVYAHWGDEYEDVPERVKQWTKNFMDSGADAVIGSHPHVVQGWGSMDGKPYYYSLGNFIFDQYWNADVSNGLAVEVIFNDSHITTHEFNVRLNRDRRSCIATE